MGPVPAGIEVADGDAVSFLVFQFHDLVGDDGGHEHHTPTRPFVVEGPGNHGVQSIGVVVVLHQEIPGDLGHGVGGHGTQGVGFTDGQLGDFLRFGEDGLTRIKGTLVLFRGGYDHTVHFTGTSKHYLGVNILDPHGFQEIGGTNGVDILGVQGAAEGKLHTGLGCQVEDHIGLGMVQGTGQGGYISQVSLQHLQFVLNTLINQVLFHGHHIFRPYKTINI